MGTKRQSVFPELMLEYLQSLLLLLLYVLAFPFPLLDLGSFCTSHADLLQLLSLLTLVVHPRLHIIVG